MAAASAAAFHHSILCIRIRIRGVRYRQYSCYGIRGIRILVFVVLVTSDSLSHSVSLS